MNPLLLVYEHMTLGPKRVPQKLYGKKENDQKVLAGLYFATHFHMFDVIFMKSNLSLS